MIDEDTNVQLIKKIRSLIDLSELYDSYYAKRSKLHLRPADVPTSELVYELSVGFDLLDQTTQNELEPYIEKINTGPKSALTHSNETKNIIRSEHIEKVADIIGVELEDQDQMNDIYDQFVQAYDELYQQLVKILGNGEEVEVYGGKKYYPRKIEAQHAFSIDQSKIYMMDYSVDDDIPMIYQNKPHETLIRAIKIACYPEDEVAFYTRY